MSRIAPVAEPTDRQQAQFNAIKASLGGVPNIFKHMGRAPALLDGYLGLSKSLSGGRLGAAEREALALSLAGRNGCDYCAAAHTAIGKGQKIAADELAANLQGQSAQGRVQALIDFARALQTKVGRVEDAEIARVRAAGYDDEQILEVVGAVAANILTNTFNNLVATPVDFPAVTLPARQAA